MRIGVDRLPRQRVRRHPPRPEPNDQLTEFLGTVHRQYPEVDVGREPASQGPRPDERSPDRLGRRPRQLLQDPVQPTEPLEQTPMINRPDRFRQFQIRLHLGPPPITPKHRPPVDHDRHRRDQPRRPHPGPKPLPVDDPGPRDERLVGPQHPPTRIDRHGQTVIPTKRTPHRPEPQPPDQLPYRRIIHPLPERHPRMATEPGAHQRMGVDRDTHQPTPRQPERWVNRIS